MPTTAQDLDRLTAILAGAVGERRAVTIQAMADRAGLSRREVEQALEVHLSDFPFPLVSGSAGYWQPTTPDQINHYRHSLTSRLRALARRMDTVAAKARAAGWKEEGGRFTAAPVQQYLPL